MGGNWGSPVTMDEEPSSESDDMNAGAPASHGLGPPMASEKKCERCGKIKNWPAFTASGFIGRGWCEECRKDYAASIKAKRNAAKEEAKNEEPVSSTRSCKAAKLNQSIPQEYENAFGRSSKSAQPLSKPSGRKPYVQTKLCQFCGIPHHWRQKCPTAPPAAMRKEPTKSPIRKKRVARLPSPSMLQGPRATSAAMHETTQRPWTASSAPDGLRCLREELGTNYVHKLVRHREPPEPSKEVQCELVPVGLRVFPKNELPEFVFPQRRNEEEFVPPSSPSGKVMFATVREINAVAPTNNP